jgi:putative ABC transport system permease protein
VIRWAWRLLRREWRQQILVLALLTLAVAAVPGSVDTVDFRAQDPHGRYGAAMLRLLEGRYPTGAGDIAVTDEVAKTFKLHLGDRFDRDGHDRTVVGLVENPTDLLDEFTLVSPGQAGRPAKAVSSVEIEKPSGGVDHR